MHVSLCFFWNSSGCGVCSTHLLCMYPNLSPFAKFIADVVSLAIHYRSFSFPTEYARCILPHILFPSAGV